MPATPTYGFPFPPGEGVPPDVPADLEALALAIEARIQTMNAGAVEIGGMYPYVGNTDPAGGNALLADGRLVDVATYPTFFARAGHRYNNNVDPGGGKCRLPDKRGRGSFGADSFGTAAGAAGRRTTTHLQGNSGGAEKITLTTPQMPVHSHVLKNSATITEGGDAYYGGTLNNRANLATETAGGGLAHDNMPPHETDYWLVRVK